MIPDNDMKAYNIAIIAEMLQDELRSLAFPNGRSADRALALAEMIRAHTADLADRLDPATLDIRIFQAAAHAEAGPNVVPFKPRR